MALVSPNGTGENQGSGTSLTLTRPSGWVSGVVALVIFGIKGGQNVAFTAGTGIPTGWSQTNITRINHGTNIAYIAFWKVLGGSEPASYTWTITSSRVWTIQGRGYSGRAQTLPIDVSSGQTAATSATATAPGVTVASDNTDLVWASVLNRGVSGGAAHTPPAGFGDEIETNSGVNNTHVTLATADQVVNAGAIAAQSATWTDAALNIGAMIAILPSTATLTRTATPITVAVQTQEQRTATPITIAVQDQAARTASPITIAIGEQLARTATPVTVAVQTQESRTATPITVAIQQRNDRTATPITLAIQTEEARTASPITISISEGAVGEFALTATPITIAVQTQESRTATPITIAVQQENARTATPITLAIQTREQRTATPITIAVQEQLARTATPVTLSIQTTESRTATGVTISIATDTTRVATPITIAIQQRNDRTATPITIAILTELARTASPITIAVGEVFARTASPITIAIQQRNQRTATGVTISISTPGDVVPTIVGGGFVTLDDAGRTTVDVDGAGPATYVEVDAA